MCYALLLHYGGIRDGQRAPCVCYAVLWQLLWSERCSQMQYRGSVFSADVLRAAASRPPRRRAPCVLCGAVAAPACAESTTGLIVAAVSHRHRRRCGAASLRRHQGRPACAVRVLCGAVAAAVERTVQPDAIPWLCFLGRCATRCCLTAAAPACAVCAMRCCGSAGVR